MKIKKFFSALGRVAKKVKKSKGCPSECEHCGGIIFRRVSNGESTTYVCTNERCGASYDG
jgi:hypothetical protein